jgi:tetratricopeptide (TPR) repeat protein
MQGYGFLRDMPTPWCLALFLITTGIAPTPGAERKPAALTPEQLERLKECDRLAAEAQKHDQQGRFGQMVAAWEKKLAIEREVLGREHPVVLQSLTALASMNEFRDDFKAARDARLEVLRQSTKRYGDKDWRVTDARLALQDLDQLSRLDIASRQRLREAAALNTRAVGLYQQGRVQEALPLARRAAEIRRKLLGENHADYATSLNNVAVFYKQLGNYAAARPLYERARDLRRRVLTENHPAYATSLHNLAALYEATGDCRRALPLAERARDLRKRLLTENHPEYADSLNSLAVLYQAVGEYRRALPLFQHARDLYKKLVGADHPAYATSLNNLAGLYQDMGDYGQALTLYKQARDLRRKLLGEHHPDYAGSLNNLATLYFAQGEYVKARALLLRAADLRKERLGGDHPEYAQSLNNLAASYRAADDYPMALSLYERARAIYKRRFGVNHPAYAQSLESLALLYHAMGDYPRALGLQQQAHALYKQLLTENHPAYAQSLNNLAVLYQAMGDYQTALDLLKQARDLRAKLLTENHPDYAASLNNLAALYQDMGDYQEALPLYERARDITKARLTASHPAYATTLSNLAKVHHVMGDYPGALALFEEARRLCRQRLADSHADDPASLGDLALLYKDLGDYPKALVLAEQARDLRKRLLSENHPEYATSLNDLARLYQAMGDYPRALTLFDEARRIREKRGMESHHLYADSLHNLGGLYQDMGDYAKALRLYQQARDLDKKLLTTNHPNYATCLHNLATLYRDMGDYPRALVLSEEARDLYKKLLTEKHPSYAAALDNLAGLYEATGEYRRALMTCQTACDLRKHLLSEDHPAYASSLNNLAALYQDMGDCPTALDLYQRAHELFKKHLTKNHPECSKCLHNLALLHYAMGEPRRAAQLLDQALTFDEAFFERTFTALSDRQRLDFVARLKYTLDAYLSVCGQAETATSRRYEIVLAWKNAVAARAAEERSARGRPDLQVPVERLRQVRAGLAQVARTPPARAEQRADWLKRFGDLEGRKEALEIRLAEASAAYRHLRAEDHAKAGDVTRAVLAGAALVDFLEYQHWIPQPARKGHFRTERRLVAFVLTHDRPVVCVPLGPAEPVDQAVQDWRRTAADGTALPDTGAAAELARRVWQPLRKHLAGVSTVLIAPDAALCSLPFGALPGSKPGTYLLEEYAIGYVTSGRHLLELATDADAPTGRSLLAVGGLVYGHASPSPAPEGLPAFMRKPVWGELPGTRLEVDRVVHSYRPGLPRERAARLLVGDEADVRHLKQALTPQAGQPQWRFLHLATHGFFEAPPPRPPRPPAATAFTFDEARQTLTYGRNPLLLSGLVLSGANRFPDRGILTAEEVADLDLRGTELVVLSACETGLGKVAGGEGVLGLQRAFQAAGARSLAVSLWSVNDAATSVLMDEFYANLWTKRLPKLEALRQAQLTVLREPERVEKRRQELRALLVRRGVPEDELATRGIGKRALPLPPGGGVASAPRRSPPAWWAAFVLSGDPGGLSHEPPPRQR